MQRGVFYWLASDPMQDRLLSAADTALRTLFATPRAAHPSPATGIPEAELSPAEKKLSASYMRVNHVGEVCAQALYTAQAMVTRDEHLREHLLEAAQEEMDHLAWTHQRLQDLGERPSLLNPLWFAGAFLIGTVAAKVSDRASLGFVEETENQVSLHLKSHLDLLPAQDAPSRAVVSQMKADEERHAAAAVDAGALPVPLPARVLMKIASKVMTATAHHI